MFGLGSRVPDHYNLFLELMVDDWEVRAKYVAPFLDAYHVELSANFTDGVRRHEALLGTLSRDQQLLMMAQGSNDPRPIAVAAMAYLAYTRELVAGVHIGTDIERMVWLILCNVPHLWQDFNPALAKYIVETQPVKYPKMWDEMMRYSA